MKTLNETIVAPATGSGGAIAIIRLSGEASISIVDRIFHPHSGKPLAEQRGFTLHYGMIRDQGRNIDDVLVSLFRSPHSYTGENMVEISCHASSYIQQEILRLCIAHGARGAQPGEFTLRAFLAGKMDLSQAEAVADVIAANNQASHALATQQIRGGYSAEFAHLRQELIHVMSLLELELDFGEEDVEFADREQMSGLLEKIKCQVERLTSSFALGNIVKNGVPVILVGSPNVGKSTLLNALVHEEKAIVSDIPGTTRDVIEENINIDGVLFRFIDTAGIRSTNDPLESMGIERTFQHLSKAAIVLLLVDARDEIAGIRSEIDTIDLHEGQRAAILLNKTDKVSASETAHKKRQLEEFSSLPVLDISAKNHTHMEQIIHFLQQSVDRDRLNSDEIIVFNARHHEALQSALESISRAEAALLDGLPHDLLAQDLREVLHHLETITGEITTDDILQSVFSNFCIGK